ncbi:response regulator transcription factor [Leeia sp. TBRC 13508]|uniref:Response regulator transcription factor n=1 Tax=Leeia speluncae TaxID=2884804 RepID=A0ABS8D441_9NEIS|nr:response regulator transcription factor [Leeia speluncae]MCB6182741.1 response regulator transcription factor [Leeia speluncae]
MHEDLPQLLLVDDDEAFRRVAARGLSKRGFAVTVCTSAEEAKVILPTILPDYALLDLKMSGASGLSLIPDVLAVAPLCRIVMLTGYASITTAVEAIKLGATHYLPKPAGMDEIIAAFDRLDGDLDAADDVQPMSVDRLEWEHIQRVLAEHDGNISATARALNMHRRTLQRKLGKRPVKQ